MSTVAEIVARLIAVGCPADVAAVAVTEAFAAGSVCGKSADKADISAERRREKDRIRKAEIRRQSAESAESPQNSKSALTLSSLSEKENSKKEGKKVRARKSTLSADWQPKESHFEAAEKLKIPRSGVVSKAEDMRIWAGSTGALKVDWDLTFHGFLRRDAEKLSSQNNGKANAKNPVLAAADALVERMRDFDRPAPGEVRGGASAVAIRAIPQGRRERPGDLRGVDSGDLVGLSGGNDPVRDRPEDWYRGEPVDGPGDGADVDGDAGRGQRQARV